MNTFSVGLKPDTNFVYTFFVWTASNCSPNRDGGTGEIRVDPQRRVFTTQECFNQNVKNGVFFANQSGLVDASEGCELMGCKNEFFGPRTLTGALKAVLASTAQRFDKEQDDVEAGDVFRHCFDIPMFGLVNSNGLKHPAFPHSITGSAGLVYLPKTVTSVAIQNRGISNAFAQPKSKDDDTPNDMPGSHYTDYLEEGVFCCLGLFNIKQLEFIAREKLGLDDSAAARKRIEQLYNLYLTGLWEGFKLLGYASTMRKGQQPYALYSAQRQTLPDYIPDPAAILMNEDGNLPMHESFAKTINALEQEKNLPAWMARIAPKDDWDELKKMEL